MGVTAGSCITYREFPASDELRPFVECYWWRAVTTGSTPDRHLVLPDGCIDILFDVTRAPYAFVVGAMTRSITVSTRAESQFVAVRYRPGGAFPFFRVPMREWTDELVDLEDAWGDCRRLTERLGGLAPCVSIRALDVELRSRLAGAQPVDGRFQAAVAWLGDTAQTLSVRQISDRLGMSRQFLTRRFKELTGLGPKQMARILRSRRLLRSVQGVLSPSWTAAAQAAGYCDQSHMIGEFKALTGLTPARYHASRAV